MFVSDIGRTVTGSHCWGVADRNGSSGPHIRHCVLFPLESLDSIISSVIASILCCFISQCSLTLQCDKATVVHSMSQAVSLSHSLADSPRAVSSPAGSTHSVLFVIFYSICVLYLFCLDLCRHISTSMCYSCLQCSVQ